MPIRYGQSLLFTETDENDLTYFIVEQSKVIRKAIEELHLYIEQKSNEIKESEDCMRVLDFYNHRQATLLVHALKKVDQIYSFESHRRSHNVAYQTARTDLLGLLETGLLVQENRGSRYRVSRSRVSRLLRHLLNDCILWC